jgi:hypothetical protein
MRKELNGKVKKSVANDVNNQNEKENMRKELNGKVKKSVANDVF